MAQQRPQYQHYIQNGMLINPAITGIEDFLSARVGYRKQWSGIEGAPSTAYFSIQTPLNILTNRRKKPFLPIANNPKVSPQHGIGATFFNDQIGPFQQNEWNLNYAYHLPISPKTLLSAGFSGGMQSNRLNQNMLNFANPGDPVTGQFSNQHHTVVSLGLWLSNEKYFSGISLFNRFSNQSETSPSDHQHFLFSAGYKLVFLPKFELATSTLVKYFSTLPLTTDFNLTAGFNQKIWAGISWRTANEFILFSRLLVNDYLDVSYSYATGLGNSISANSHGNHEISIGLRLFNRDKIFCPQHFW